MKISFGNGFVKIPSKNKVFNPDNVLTITEYDNKKSNILLQDCMCIEGVNATVDEIAKACTLAQKTSETIKITEGVDYKA